jgi:hypothetical protein
VQPDGTEDWIVKRIRTMQAFHIRDTEAYRDMVASAYYVLTHGAVEKDKHTTTWFGEVHPATFSPEEELTASAWHQIQKQAEIAVKEDPSEEGGGSSHGPDECPVDGCEHVVKDLLYLPEYLDDEEWVEQVRTGRDGRERIARLRGAYAWWQNRTDRPPPSVMSDEERMRNWLQKKGETFMPRIRQSSLQTAVM